jgi:hypothetical protein
MAYQRLKQSSKQWETPQIEPDQLSTEVKGGMAPDKRDIVESVNARAQKRHEMKKQPLADMEVLPDSSELIGDERVGIRDWGYLAKKNTPYGVNAFFNSLPPGMDIEDQEICDIRQMTLRTYDGGMGYPGDGWSMRTRGSQMPMKKDVGRPETTNYVGNDRLGPPEVSGGGN